MKKRRKGRIREFEREPHGKSPEVYQQERQAYAAAQAVRRKKRRFRVNKGRLALTAIVLALLVAVGISIKTVFDLRAEQQNLEDTHQALTDKKTSLKEELNNVNEWEYIEEQARIQLKLIKPGEILYVLPNDGTQADASQDGEDAGDNTDDDGKTEADKDSKTDKDAETD